VGLNPPLTMLGHDPPMVATTFQLSRTNTSALAEWWRSVDHLLLGMLICLIGAGLILSMAASPAAAQRIGYADPFYVLYRHLFFAVAGLSGALTLSFFSVTQARRFALLAMLGALVILLIVDVSGHTVKGATRWIRIGSFGLQPSEFAKPAFIVFAAWMFAAAKRSPDTPAFPIVFGLYLVLIAFFMRQPDFGQSFLLTLCFAAVFFFAGLSLAWLALFMGVSLLGGVGAYLALPHVRSRLDRFLNPENADTYQTDKALEAIGQGRLFGRGPGEGAVKYQLPDGHTDFIFALTVEEFGLLISAALIMLLAAFVMRAYRLALRLNDYFRQLAVAGLATMIGMQTVINLFVNLNLAPPKGMTLPFISYGGSSMLALCFAAGLILAFTRRHPGAFGYGD